MNISIFSQESIRDFWTSRYASIRNVDARAFDSTASSIAEKIANPMGLIMAEFVSPCKIDV